MRRFVGNNRGVFGIANAKLISVLGFQFGEVQHGFRTHIVLGRRLVGGFDGRGGSECEFSRQRRLRRFVRLGRGRRARGERSRGLAGWGGQSLERGGSAGRRERHRRCRNLCVLARRHRHTRGGTQGDQRISGTTGPVYRLEFDFASEDPGGADDRSLSLSTRDGDNNALRTTFRINGDGDFQSFNGGWVTVLPEAIVFDDDVTVSPLVHRFSMTVDSNIGTFDLEITDSNNIVHSVLGSTIWRGTPPIGAGASAIEFNTFNSNGDSLIDNVTLVSIPEPSTMVLLGMLGIAAVARYSAKEGVNRRQ